MNLHRHQPIVWSYQGSTTATLCSTELRPATSTYFSKSRTMQPGSFYMHQGNHTPSHYCTSCTGCQSNSRSRTSWLCGRSKSTPFRCRRTSADTLHLVALYRHGCMAEGRNSKGRKSKRNVEKAETQMAEKSKGRKVKRQKVNRQKLVLLSTALHQQ